jgi:hypothetical protein
MQSSTWAKHGKGNFEAIILQGLLPFASPLQLHTHARREQSSLWKTYQQLMFKLITSLIGCHLHTHKFKIHCTKNTFRSQVHALLQPNKPEETHAPNTFRQKKKKKKKNPKKP